MKLHIGCGKKYLHGWTNLDIHAPDGSSVDIIDNAKTLESIADDACDIIYACHILEHFGRHEYVEILKTWYKKLKKGGILRLSVPDFDKIVKIYNDSDDLDLILGLIVGGQNNRYDYHNMIFNKKSLLTVLSRIGFSEIREWDWRTSIHSHMDDYSQAFLPHMDKENGVLMSLNLEGVK